MLWTSFSDYLGARVHIYYVPQVIVIMEQFRSVRRNKEKQIYFIPDKYQYAMGGLVPFF